MRDIVHELRLNQGRAVEGQGRKQFRAGEVYHEAVNRTMQARNPSASARTTLIAFQVGAKGEPLMLVAKPPRR
jgi:hypothetical protein